MLLKELPKKAVTNVRIGGSEKGIGIRPARRS
jgi:hypothetical protein